MSSHHSPTRPESRNPSITIVEPPLTNTCRRSSTQPAHDHLEDIERTTSSGHGPDENGDYVQPLRSTFRTWLRRSASPRHKTRSSEQPDSQQYHHSMTNDPASNLREHPGLSPYAEEAASIARKFTDRNLAVTYQPAQPESQSRDIDEYSPDVDYVAPPKEYKPSVFGALLASKLTTLERQNVQQRNFYQNAVSSRQSLVNTQSHRHKRARSDNMLGATSGTTTPKDTKWFEKSEYSALAGMLVHSATSSPDRSGVSTPKKIKWYDKPEHSALASMLVHSALPLASPGLPETTRAASFNPRSRGPSRRASMEKAPSYFDMEKAAIHPRSRRDSHSSQEMLINELRDILACRNYLTKLCGALMRYGAPSHRIEEHLRASARALAIDADFLYIPGAMICTFIDNTMQANSVQVVRQNSGLDFGRLKDVFAVYKCVIHNKYGADLGLEELDNIITRRDDHGDLFRILMFGLASVVVGPFSFNTRPIDFAPIFILGCCLGFAQIKIVPRSDQFSNVFEVFACVLIAFAARGLGSVRWPGSEDYVFCFSGVAQSSIAMILPGFMVLNSALELQSRNVVSGSVRMVYSIIYVLFLAFGLLIGTTIFGLMKRDAVAEVSCKVPEWWTPGLSYRLLYTRFIWAPLFACTVAKIYKAKWKQLPIMALIATAGHQANFWISTQLSSNLQVANAIGAFVIGCIANLYSRMFHGLAAAAMLPAIYCQVPGGLAASGSLVAGIDSSNQIFGNSSTISVINNGTTGFVQAQQDPNSVYGGTIFNVGYGMVQVAIGISVGLYLSALVVYPFGKRRSGLSSF